MHGREILSYDYTYIFKATFNMVRELVSKKDFIRDITLIDSCVYTVKSHKHSWIARDRHGAVQETSVSLE